MDVDVLRFGNVWSDGRGVYKGGQGGVVDGFCFFIRLEYKISKAKQSIPTPS
jgi:hypothetical protein